MYVFAHLTRDTLAHFHLYPPHFITTPFTRFLLFLSFYKHLIVFPPCSFDSMARVAFSFHLFRPLS